MSRGFTAQQQQFWTHIIEKENRQRLGWFMKHQSHLIQEKENEIEQKKDEDVRKVRQPRRRPDLLDIGEPSIDTTDVMRPVDADVRRLISSGGKKYLEKRSELAPRDKFYFKESQNWDYGWNVDEASYGTVNLQGTRHGRVNVIKESFYRRGGAEPDSLRYCDLEEANLPLPLI